MVKHKGFIAIMQSAQPSLVLPGRKTLRNDCIQLYKEMKDVEMARMAKASHISLTNNLWTASDLTGYMVITAHYISKQWELTKLIVGFKPLPPPHSGQAIGNKLSQTLLEWKSLLKAAFITLDNASSNNVAVTRLQRFVNKQSRSQTTPVTSSYFHVRPPGCWWVLEENPQDSILAWPNKQPAGTCARTDPPNYVAGSAGLARGQLEPARLAPLGSTACN
ncbi:hypothetical protein PCANC_04327 [Puccinia coronata f. sp. avenae]|uniref:HAT C-terminal dimerisation domain-containing protein n=1 Tax=Puccinia coronata f. sp. avenae TaxID=200324 RepID=A0A2N5VUP7_9BASI|nr:hypothetical protein PCANC_04327 [Puccinia coronata f. sp. avenae]